MLRADQSLFVSRFALPITLRIVGGRHPKLNHELFHQLIDPLIDEMNAWITNSSEWIAESSQDVLVEESSDDCHHICAQCLGSDPFCGVIGGHQDVLVLVY